MPVEDIDFFGEDMKQVDFGDQQNSPTKEQKATNFSSLTSMFSNMVGKANVFNFGKSVAKNTAPIKNFRSDNYDSIRQRIQENFRPE